MMNEVETYNEDTAIRECREKSSMEKMIIFYYLNLGDSMWKKWESVVVKISLRSAH